MKKYDKAVESFTKATEIEPFNADYFAALALALYKTGKTEDAFNALSNSFLLDSKSYLYYRCLGTIRLKIAKKNKEKCDSGLAEIFNKAVDLTPIDLDWQMSNSYVRRAEYYLYIGELDDALKDLNDSIKLRKDNETAWFYFSKYYEKIGNNKEGKRYLKKAIEIGYTPEQDD